MRETAGAESRRGAGELRTVFDEVTSEIGAKLDRALAQFRGATEDVRSTAEAVHEELDRTREDLKRGVAGLPRETQETTAEMRRVVTDQIKALNELASLVSRSHQGLDVSPAAEGPSRRAIAEARRPEPLAPPPASVARPAPAAAPPARPRAEPSDPGEQEAAVSLSSISGDIAGMLDSGRAADLWLRHRGGEAGIFTPEIYAPEDRGTFEEIRRKYRTEPGFSTTVERYVGEFERLLDKLPETDEGEATARAYLGSDTGKVFLVLAHASGHFG